MGVSKFVWGLEAPNVKPPQPICAAPAVVVVTKLGVEGCPVTVNGKHMPGQRGPKIGPSRLQKARKLIFAYWAIV